MAAVVMPWARATCPKSSWTFVTILVWTIVCTSFLGLDHFVWYLFWVDLSDFWLLWFCPGLEQLAQRVPELLSLFLVGPFFVVVFGFGPCLWHFFGG